MMRLSVVRVVGVILVVTTCCLLMTSVWLLARGRQLADLLESGDNALREHRYHDAISTYKAFVSRRPQARWPWLGMAIALYHMGDFSGSLSALDSCLQGRGLVSDDMVKYIRAYVQNVGAGQAPEGPVPRLLQAFAPCEPEDSSSRARQTGR